MVAHDSRFRGPEKIFSGFCFSFPRVSNKRGHSDALYLCVSSWCIWVLCMPLAAHVQYGRQDEKDTEQQRVPTELLLSLGIMGITLSIGLLIGMVVLSRKWYGENYIGYFVFITEHDSQ